jgi:hypothetical protein
MQTSRNYLMTTTLPASPAATQQIWKTAHSTCCGIERSKPASNVSRHSVTAKLSKQMGKLEHARTSIEEVRIGDPTSSSVILT